MNARQMKRMLGFTGGFIPSLCLCGVLLAQVAPGPAFEVASVKLRDPKTQGSPAIRGGPGTETPGQITVGEIRLLALIRMAYGLETYQLIESTAIPTGGYEINAKVQEGATKEQVPLMWQNLLVERFGLRVHREQREFDVYDLLTEPGGAKLKISTMRPDPGRTGMRMGRDAQNNPVLMGPGSTVANSGRTNGFAARLMANGQPVSTIARMLSNQLKRPVIDKTGLTDFYDVIVDFTKPYDDTPPNQIPTPEFVAQLLEQKLISSVESTAPNLPTALRQDAGLRLVSAKAMLDVLVVDKIEKSPTDN